MNTALLAIKRPVFITSIVVIIVVLGIISYRNIGLELTPDMTFPKISVVTIYSGAAPEEIDQLITKPLEDEFGALSGIKHISSENTEGLSVISLEFNMEVDIDKVSNDVRDKINQAKNRLPDDLTDDPVVKKFDPNATAVIKIALESDLPAAELYDIANERVKPRLTRIDGVGTVDILGGTRREIQIELDQNKLNEYMLPMTTFVNQVKKSGSNVPAGTEKTGNNKGNQIVFRSMGQFADLSRIENTLVSFSGNVDNNSVTVKKLGKVRDGTEDVTSMGYIYRAGGKEGNQVRPCVFLSVIKQSGSNTVKVADSVKAQLDEINTFLKPYGGNTHAGIVVDQSHWIRVNVDETLETILIGIFLAVAIVYLFLGSMRSTLITAIAIPNSLLGAIIVMWAMDYTFNLTTLMGMSLVVGLLVDDAIVVRENIFRKLESGMEKFKAAEMGTTEVMLAVVATTLAIIAVFFPVGMVQGMMGKFFRQFCFTIVFAMLVSLFDALTVAPFLSAYFAGTGEKSNSALIRYFENFQKKTDLVYERVIRVCLNHPLAVIAVTLSIFAGSVALLSLVKFTFMPTGDRGEFSISIEMPPGTSVYGTADMMKKIGKYLEKLEDLDYYSATAGNSQDEPTKGTFDCQLRKDRKGTTEENKEKIRKLLKDVQGARLSIGDSGGSEGGSAFSLVVSGYELSNVEETAQKILEQVRTIPDLVDADSSVRKGNPEFRVSYDPGEMQRLGVSSTSAGTELRYNIYGAVVGKFRDDNLDYDIRARLRPDQRNLSSTFARTRVPNSNGNSVPLHMVADGGMTTGSAKITRSDKLYTVTITANLAADGAIGSAMSRTDELIKKNVPLPKGISCSYRGQSENFTDFVSNIIFAMTLGFLFIYLVLASLYESFITPLTILLAVPPAFTGAFLGLFVTGEMLNIFSMIGMIMLMGLVTKNSILLVDHAVKGVRSGLDRKEAILQAGMRRLRPILMTTFAMLAGTLPLALGIGEAAKMRRSMGIAIMGGLIFSTLLTLIVIPAVFELIDKFREATESKIIVRPKEL